MAASTGPLDLTSIDGPFAGPTGLLGSWPRWFASALAACTMMMGASTEASAQSRTLKMYHVHNREHISVVYRRGGSYDAAALKKINVFFRDWRKNQPTKMDPRLLDVLWEVQRRTGGREIHVIGGYRSPATNSMLRSRSKGVAKNSQHVLGKAADFFIPGVSLKTLRNTGLQLQAGGVGYYPSSGSPFVHMDVGNVRHWPRIGQSELASIMSKGNKIGSGGTVLASAGRKSGGGFLSAFFGRGAEEEDGESVEETPVVKPARKPAAKPNGTVPGIDIVPPELASPAERPQVEPQEEVVETPETIIAALPTRNIPIPAFAPRPQADVAPQQPETVDMAEALDDPATAVPAEAEAEVALGIPLPTWRPNQAPQAPDADATALLAMAATEVATDVAEVGAPLPMERPADGAKQGRVTKATQVAAVEQPAKLTTASIEPVKTTRKESRPSRTDNKPAPRAVVVAAQPASARWALDKNYVSAKSKGTTAPSFAYNVVRTAPLEVYTAGFQQGGTGGDINRFTGKAVKFLTVARFEDN
jgi:uncharacterized protein YcbK (DUF882 family)